MTMNTRELYAAIAECSGLSPDQVERCMRAFAELVLEMGKEIPDAKDIDEVERFWTCFADAVRAGKLVKQEDFHSDGLRVWLFWRDVHAAYLVHYSHRYGRDGLPNPHLLKLLKKHPCYVTMLDSHWIGKRKSTAHVFDQTRLPVAIPPSPVKIAPTE